MNKLSRNKEVDIAKGIGIILVVVGHAGCIPELKNFIFTFHMALFFILSGLFINPVSTIVGGGNLIKRKIRSLYIPFITWGLLFLVLRSIFCKIGWYEGLELTANGWLKQSASIILFTGVEPICPVLWFVKSLFVGNLLTVFVITLVSSKYLRIGIFFLLFTFDWIISYNGIHLIWSIERELVVSCTLFIGYYIKDHIGNLITRSNFVVSILILLVGSIITKIDVAISEFGLYLIYPVLGISGFICTMYISKYMSNFKISNFVSWVGCNSLYILILHYLGFKLCTSVLVAMDILPQTYLSYIPTPIPLIGSWYWIIYTCIGILVPCCYIIIRNYCKTLFRFDSK